MSNACPACCTLGTKNSGIHEACQFAAVRMIGLTMVIIFDNFDHGMGDHIL